MNQFIPQNKLSEDSDAEVGDTKHLLNTAMLRRISLPIIQNLTNLDQQKKCIKTNLYKNNFINQQKTELIDESGKI